MNNLTLEFGWAVAWFALFTFLVLVLAYRRASLAAATAVLGLALLAYWVLGAAADWWKIAVSVPVALLLLLNLRGLHGLVGRRIVHGRPELAKIDVGEGAAPQRRRACIPRRTLRRTVRNARRLGHHASTRRPSP